MFISILKSELWRKLVEAYYNANVNNNSMQKKKKKKFGQK
jgi:hypothetical protein